MQPSAMNMGRRRIPMIDVKRNCSSSVRTTLDKITFGDFTITIDGDAYDMWRKVKQLADKSDTGILSAVIYAGLLSLTEEDEP